MWLLEGRTLGITGQVTRLVEGASDLAAENEAAAFAKRDPNDVLAALAAATAEATGATVEAPSHQPDAGSRLDMQRHIPLVYRAMFLVFIALGAATAAWSDGTLAARFDLGDVHTAFVGSGWQRILLLLGGGVAVGFGTRMSGGCTSGHGLTGCARLVPRSLLATMTFLGTAIAFTLATKALM
jgi:hypothetical protein